MWNQKDVYSATNFKWQVRKCLFTKKKNPINTRLWNRHVIFYHIPKNLQYPLMENHLCHYQTHRLTGLDMTPREVKSREIKLPSNFSSVTILVNTYMSARFPWFQLSTYGPWHLQQLHAQSDIEPEYALFLYNILLDSWFLDEQIPLMLSQKKSMGLEFKPISPTKTWSHTTSLQLSFCQYHEFCLGRR